MIFALERLRLLRAGKSLDSLTPLDIDNLPVDWRIEFEERAAILEYDGGLTREDAETQAYDEIQKRMETNNRN